CLTLGEIVLSAVETSTPLINACNHRFSVEVHNEAILLNADAARLAQVLSNLLNNAAKYTPPGGEIRLSSWDDGLDLFIAVKDNGIGLSESAISSVFEMFSRSEERRVGKECRSWRLAGHERVREKWREW